jgi:hypothetical protein
LVGDAVGETARLVGLELVEGESLLVGMIDIEGTAEGTGNVEGETA